MIVGKISTLTISSDEYLSRIENYYIKALSYLFECFNNMQHTESHSDVLSIYIKDNTFLVGSRTDEKQDINPFAFVDKRGNILFEISIDDLSEAINDFNKYIKFYENKHPEMPRDKCVKEAIDDYKNDKLDFYTNNGVIMDSIIEKARKQYELEYE